MIGQLLQSLAQLLGFGTAVRGQPLRQEQRYVVEIFDDRAAASMAAKRTGVAALVRGGHGYKWMLFTCPCGCKQQIALNMMRSHSPRWRVEVRSRNLFTVHPSVDSTTCGAHFWLRDGRVIWCE
ncbi:DUF6527 family protein [Thiobacillus sp. 0-1251]|uniref:DUF6527 family protein n=1 Tax=Thiobacillus sp. 0-1251 TaxID=1895858 RepID=UPI00341755D5